MAGSLIDFDPEKGKKDDDYRPRRRAGSRGWVPGNVQRLLLPRNVKRIGIGAVALLLLYFFFKNMPTDLKQPSIRPIYKHGDTQRPKTTAMPAAQAHGQAPSERTETGRAATPAERYTYSGKIMYFELANSLREIDRTGEQAKNSHVLYAASTLKSASKLLPLACEMSNFKRNTVHFAFMGRDPIPMKTIMAINGVDKGCDIMLHDARPDQGEISTEYRMAVSVSAALGHIERFMHPQVVILDASGAEEKYFLQGIQDRAVPIGKTVIRLPGHAAETLRWHTRLDASSLKAFDKISIDIMIHGQPSASGSLIRLLQSLSRADYFDSAPPRLTIELPHELDETASTFISDHFRWPPGAEGNSQHVTLRRRMRTTGSTAGDSSIRFLESFWPANRATSHVLILSPQAELSPMYYHYLKYAILEYKYSANAGRGLAKNALLGISLDLPSTYLNDTTTFDPPSAAGAVAEYKTPPSFLWGAPNSNAALYFGDKWTESYDFLSAAVTHPNNAAMPKLVGKTYPSWMEYLLVFMRTRGYAMLYPQLEDDEALVTLHNELFQPPEEFSAKYSDPDLGVEDDDFTADPSAHLSLQHKEQPLVTNRLLDVLPNNGQLMPLSSMPVLTYDGREVFPAMLRAEAEEFSLQFREAVGGCRKPIEIDMNILDIGVKNLFCDGEEEGVLGEEKKDDEGVKAEKQGVKPKEMEEFSKPEMAEKAKSEAAEEVNPKAATKPKETKGKAEPEVKEKPKPKADDKAIAEVNPKAPKKPATKPENKLKAIPATETQAKPVASSEPTQKSPAQVSDEEKDA